MVMAARCLDCEWMTVLPERSHAEHAKRVHERETDHTVTLEPE